MADGLTAQQELFAKAYIKLGNAAEAAHQAGIRLRPSGKGFYVYFLIDGNSGDIFYVGKGSGNRLKHHRRQTKAASGNHVKIDRILACKGNFEEVVFADDLDEVEAFRLERVLIKRFRESLTNISAGKVHPAQSHLAYIDRCISKLMPFDMWVASARQWRIDLAARVHGSARAAYEHETGWWNLLRSEAAERLNLIKQKSNV